MIDLLGLILLSTLFAYVVQSRTYMYNSARDGMKKDLQSKVIYWGLLIAFIVFAGLRRSYNDTITYIQGFDLVDLDNIRLSTILEPYGGFKLYQQLIKNYISNNSQVFLFISAIVTTLLYFVIQINIVA